MGNIRVRFNRNGCRPGRSYFQCRPMGTMGRDPAHGIPLVWFCLDSFLYHLVDYQRIPRKKIIDGEKKSMEKRMKKAILFFLICGLPVFGQPRILPGMLPEDVGSICYANGLSLQRDISKKGPCWIALRECREYYLEIRVVGERGGVCCVQCYAMLLKPLLKETKDMLISIAGIPYDGAKPEEAKKWVEDNIDQTASKVFGPAKYMIQGSASGWLLTILAN